MAGVDRELDFGPQRDSWRIKLHVGIILNACRAKGEHHTERLQAWREKETQAERDLREKGIDFRESARPGGNQFFGAVSASDRMSASHYQQDPSINQEYVVALREAQNKVAEHLSRVRNYSQWEAMLIELPDDHELPLTFEDVEFFDIGRTAKVAIPVSAGGG